MFGKVNTKCQSKIVQLFGNKNVEGIRNLFKYKEKYNHSEQ